MTKRQIIDEILALNTSAKPGFLAAFSDTELSEYLQHLRAAGLTGGRRPRGDRRLCAAGA